MSKIPMGAKLVGQREMKARLYRKNESSSDKWAIEHYADSVGLVEVWVDVDALLRSHGEKALKNRRGSTVLAGGSIVLVARGRHEERLK